MPLVVAPVSSETGYSHYCSRDCIVDGKQNSQCCLETHVPVITLPVLQEDDADIAIMRQLLADESALKHCSRYRYNPTELSQGLPEHIREVLIAVGVAHVPDGFRTLRATTSKHILSFLSLRHSHYIGLIVCQVRYPLCQQLVPLFPHGVFQTSPTCLSMP